MQRSLTDVAGIGDDENNHLHQEQEHDEALPISVPLAIVE